MKKMLLRVLILTITLVSFNFISTPIQAATVQPMWAFMAYGSCSLAQLGSGFVEIDGETQAFATSDTVKVTLNLQQYKNSDWQTVQTVTYTNHYTDYVYGYRQYFVEAGYNYRLVADHSVQQGSTIETTQSYTGQMYID